MSYLRKPLWPILILLLLACPPVFAQRDRDNYTASTLVEISGQIAEVRHRRPHAGPEVRLPLVTLQAPIAGVHVAQADDHHLQDARLVGGAEVGVGLDPVQQDDAIGFIGVPVEIDRQADRTSANNYRNFRFKKTFKLTRELTTCLI